MLNLALVCQRDRLEAPMRVLPDPVLLLRRWEVLGCGIVAHQERGQLLGKRQRSEARVHVKAIAHLGENRAADKPGLCMRWTGTKTIVG